MNGGSRPRFVRLAAGMLVLAAVFHVQWLAACEVMPAGVSGKGCCAEGAADHAAHCDDRAQGHDCVTPFAKGASGIKLPERLTAADTTPPDCLFTASAFQDEVAGRAAGPPPWSVSFHLPDGRSLYLSSSRLRL